jgi:putative ABC transport system permease protein
MRVPILRGRNFDAGDRAEGRRVMIISEKLAAVAFAGEDPIGQRIACCEPGPNALKVVIGIAGDIRSRGPALPPRPEFYLPIAQSGDVDWTRNRTMYLLVRTAGDPAALAAPLQAAVRGVNRDLPLFDVQTMEQRLAGTLAAARFNTWLLSLLGAVGLLLAATGVYGVIAHFVSQRTQEIGVRIALGATRGSVVRLILAQALRPVALGAAVGLAVALAATRILASQLVGVSRTDPLTIAVVVATLIGVALAASAVPARRAAGIDPTRALQAE